MAEYFANNARAVLNGNIGVADTTLTVDSAASFPAVNFRIVIDSEYMLVTAVSGNVLTVTRAIESSVAAQHAAGADVVHVITAGGIQAILDASELPTGGTTGQQLVKASDADGDVEWVTEPAASEPLTAGGSAGQVLTKDSGTDYDASWATPTPVLPTLSTNANTSYTILDSDAGTYIRFSSGSAKAVTFDSTLAEAEFHIRNSGAGALTLTAGGGVTLNAPALGTLVMNQYMTVTVRKVGAAEFDVIGQTVLA